MKKDEVLKILRSYDENLFVLTNKSKKFIGNEYCFIAEDLIEGKNKFKFKDFDYKIQDFMKKRLNFCKNYVYGYNNIEIHNLDDLLTKYNVKGVSAKIDKIIKLKGKDRKIKVKSGLKLGSNRFIDKQFASLFKNHTFSYHPLDDVVFAINERREIDGIIITLPTQIFS